MCALLVFGLAALFSVASTTSAPATALLSDFACWTLVLLGTKLYSLLRPERPAISPLPTDANIVSLAVLLATVCQSLGAVHWVLPYLTPTLYYLLQSTEGNILPWTSKQPAGPLRSAWDGKRKKLVIFVVIAITSSIVLLQDVSVTQVVPACLFLIAQAALLLSLGQAQSNDAPTTLMLSIEPIAVRVWPMLALVCLVVYQPQLTFSNPPVIPFCGGAIMKAVLWLLLFLLSRQGQVLALSTLSTFAASTAAVWGGGYVDALGATAVVAIGAIAQTAYLAPQGFSRRVILCFVLFPMLTFIGPSHDAFQTATGGVESPMVNHRPGQNSPNVYSNMHPIEKLSLEADATFASLVEKQSQTLPDAITEYQRRYGRSPPPHFDTWFHMAHADGVILIDEFDTMMKSFEPFWGLSPRRIRRDIKASEGGGALWKVEIRNHNLSYTHDGWMMAQIATWMGDYMEYLPDMNLTFNLLDEPRVFVPYANIEALLSGQLAKQKEFTGEDDEVELYDFINVGQQSWWDLSSAACPIDSPTSLGVFQGHDHDGHHLANGLKFVENVTEATDVCQNLEYASKHAFFSTPQSCEFTNRLVPIFSQAKPNNWADILYPSPYYPDRMDQQEYQENEDKDWAEKSNTIYWAGSTTGGLTKGDNWDKQHRQRFVDLATSGANRAVQYLRESLPGKWEPQNGTMVSLKDNIDVKFTGLVQCTDDGGCDSLKDHFKPQKGEGMSRSYDSKLVMDVDGNSFSGRFWRLLRSKSAILKQAMFKEWHDDWLVPWVHYIPISIGMSELPETLRWMLQTPEGEERARAIAEQGREWATKALRKRDVELVWFRMLLEYGRLVSDDRESLTCCSASN